jgi:AcrR family transcriptional regulator
VFHARLPHSRRMSPRPSVEEQRRKEILEAACAAIAERGFAAVRISDIAARAGTSTGTVHYYFASKEDVLHQALRYAFEQSLDRQMTELGKLRSPRRRLVRLIELNLPEDPEVRQEWIVWMEFWIEALHRPDLRPVNEELYGHWRRLVAAIIEQGQQDGSLDASVHAEDLANRLVALIDGLAIQVLLHSEQMPIRTMRRLCIEFVETELAARAELVT